MLRTRAEPNGDGSYRLSGTKIFITGGESDLTELREDAVKAAVASALKGAPTAIEAATK